MLRSGQRVLGVREGEELPEELVQSEDEQEVAVREIEKPPPFSPEVMEILEREGIDIRPENERES